jgi:steroid 5-alpha reductase family enzyme
MNVSPLLPFLAVWLAASVMMTLGWLWQRRRDNAGIVDVLWSAGLAGSGIVLAVLGCGAFWPRTLLALLSGVWGARLALHLWLRVRGEPEDGRYRQLRAHWGGNQLKWFGLFQFQALLIPLFSLPFGVAAANPLTLPGWLAFAVAIWMASVLGEHIADRQLARFRANSANHGRVCREGLWRYSRHPNYFFEWLHWFTYVALSVGGPAAWYCLSGPVLMFIFLRWISGIPYTEAQALRTRGDAYRIYQRQTSVFIPWPPRQI